jgi:murein DD-endopeptidase MepM/ murein hydrolase activator NlpD/uncharacterized protein YciI
MLNITKYSRHMKITYIKMAALISIVSFFLLPSYVKVQREGNNVYDITLNGKLVGSVSDENEADRLLWKARRNVASAQTGLYFTDAEITVSGREAWFEHFTSEEEIVSAMEEALSQRHMQMRQPAFTIKVNQCMVSLASVDEVKEVLQAALDKYQETQEFVVSLGPDSDREINVLTATAQSTKEQEDEVEKEIEAQFEAGVSAALTEMLSGITAAREETFDDFDYGVTALSYEDKVEIVESYLTADELSSVDEAVSALTEPEDVQKVYEVQSGDTLSEIALTNEIPLDKIIELNDTIEDENATIRVGEEIIITAPEPELEIRRQEEVYIEEDYEADIQYVYNDDWYTTDKVVLQQPSAGHHRIAALKTYLNEKELETEILKEEVTIEAVPKIIEIGTKIPPTYIKPISGGRLSSGFGRRSAPTKGASTYHKGIDWATPVGTTVVASSAGTVAKAGWGSGYGYVVYINHADGRQTRYAHLSKVLVKVGQQVSQGERIALSGNTGRSTGAHVHFEILIGGSQVNPLNYLN